MVLSSFLSNVHVMGSMCVEGWVVGWVRGRFKWRVRNEIELREDKREDKRERSKDGNNEGNSGAMVKGARGEWINENWTWRIYWSDRCYEKSVSTTQVIECRMNKSRMIRYRTGV